jgi:hypothetical protein
MKSRQGFVSNSSSSSFVLFGCEVPTKNLGVAAEKAIKNYMKEKYGSKDNYPTDYSSFKSWHKESYYHDLIVSEEPDTFFEDFDTYELKEIIGLEEYEGNFYTGIHPLEFQRNPDMTYNQMVKKYTQKCLDMGVPEDEISFEYIEEVTYDG